MDEAESNGAWAARAVGLELIEVTSRLDSPLGVKHGIGGVNLALLAFGVRARRLLRSSYRLLDADEDDAANALFRVMSEYLIVGRWLQKVGESGAQAWALNDLRERRATIIEVIESVEAGAGITASLEKELANIEDALRSHGGPDVLMSKRAAKKAGEATPSLADMAREIGLQFAYSYAYRLQSQTDVHATALSIDTVFEEAKPGEPGPRMRPKPLPAMFDFDPYEVGPIFCWTCSGRWLSSTPNWNGKIRWTG